MAPCGIPRIDDLHLGAVAAIPIGPGDMDTNSIGLVQQMLAGQGQAGLPNLLSPDYGVFGPRTIAAVQNFRASRVCPQEIASTRSACRPLCRQPRLRRWLHVGT
jgi:hypothetical protein